MPDKIMSIKDWKQIRKLRDSGLSYDEIAEKYSVTKQCIQQGLARKKKQYKNLCYIFEEN